MSDTTPKQTSGLAIAGLVLGILAAITSFLPIINNLSAIVALIGGVLALIALIGALRGKHTAKGLSIAGVVLAVVSFVVVLVTQSMYSAALNTALDEATSGAKPVATDNTSSEPSSDEADREDDQAANEATEEAEPAEDYSNLAVGETVQLSDGLAVTVNSVQTGLANYDDSLITCVNVTYTNNGSSSASFNVFDWKGEDANGAQRTTTYYSDSTDELNSGTLSSGGTVTGNLYFEDGTVRVIYYSNVFSSEPAAGWTIQ